MVRVKPAGEQGGALGCGPQREHVADVGVGRARLGEQVVAVVPPGDEAEVVHGRERRRPGADDARARARAATLSQAV